MRVNAVLARSPGVWLDLEDLRALEAKPSFDFAVVGLGLPAVEKSLEPVLVVHGAELHAVGPHPAQRGAEELAERIALATVLHRRLGGGAGIDAEREERRARGELSTADPDSYR
jgi:hypothetical protein